MSPNLNADHCERTRHSGKKPYSAPKLKVYGDTSHLTKAIANNTMNSDGGTGLTHKTG